MRAVRVEHQGRAVHGAIEGDVIEILDAAPWLGGVARGMSVPLAGARLLAPCEPTKVIGIGRNYEGHAKEMGGQVPDEPLFFLKPASSVIGPGASIARPRASTNVHHEAELGLVIGKRCRKVSLADAPGYVWGVTCVNDVTARDIQQARKHFTHAKGFDGFCPLGPWIVAGLPDGPRQVVCRVNGWVRQDGTTADMVFGPAALVAYLSAIMTLEPGDVISTGTPAGVGPLVAGDAVEVEVEGVGVLRNQVVEEE